MTTTPHWNERHCPCDNRDNKPHQSYCPWYPLQKAWSAAWDHNESEEYYRLKKMNPDSYAKELDEQGGPKDYERHQSGCICADCSGAELTADND